MLSSSGSFKHGTGRTSPYWFEGLCVKQACYDTLACYLADREPDRMSCHVRVVDTFRINLTA